jgi:hypothetical protein
MMQKITGTVNDPISAGRLRNPIYGTLFSMYESPIFSNKKCPSYPISHPMNANKIFAMGG